MEQPHRWEHDLRKTCLRSLQHPSGLRCLGTVLAAAQQACMPGMTGPGAHVLHEPGMSSLQATIIWGQPPLLRLGVVLCSCAPPATQAQRTLLGKLPAQAAAASRDGRCCRPHTGRRQRLVSPSTGAGASPGCCWEASGISVSSATPAADTRLVTHAARAWQRLHTGCHRAKAPADLVLIAEGQLRP